MADVAGVTGSIPDVIGSVLSVSEAFRAGKGFVFNSCTFFIKTESETPVEAEPSASAASPSAQRTAGNTKPASSAKSPQSSDGTVLAGPVILRVTSGSAGEGGSSTVVELGLKELISSDRIIGVVALNKLDQAFDAGVDSVAVEITVTKSDDRTALLTLKGFANPGGLGYAHFVALILVSLSGGASPRFQTAVKFASQSPPPQIGTGIFGKTVHVDIRDQFVNIGMARTPLF